MSEFKNYQPTVQDIRRAIEEHGQEISFTKLNEKLLPIAHDHHYKYVDWAMMKTIVEGMVRAGMLTAVRQKRGFYRYKLVGT